MRTLRLLLALLPLVVPAACGYHTPGNSDAWPGGAGRTLYVELFGNRTVEPYLDSVVTDEVVRQLSRSRQLELTEERSRADLILSGTVTGFTRQAVAYGEQDKISEYQARLAIEAALTRRSDGTVLWRESLQRSEVYPALDDKSLQLEASTLAGRAAARRLAETLLARLHDAF